MCVPLCGGLRTHSVLSLTSRSFETGPLYCLSTVYIRVFSCLCLQSRGPGATDVCATSPAFPWCLEIGRESSMLEWEALLPTGSSPLLTNFPSDITNSTPQISCRGVCMGGGGSTLHTCQVKTPTYFPSPVS